jgi:hypothetical protein
MHKQVNPTNLRPGDRVGFCGYAGEVAIKDMREVGEVVRMNRTGHPVIRIARHSDTGLPKVLTDRYGCARLIDANRRWLTDPIDGHARPD